MTRRYWALIAVPLTLFGHYAWEIGQAQLYTDQAGKPLASYALHCFVAALGDVVIASAAYAVAALAFRRASWPVAPPVLAPAVVWVAVGLAVTVAFELGATGVGLWTYAPSMPTLLGIGLSPLLQWLVVPAVTLVALRTFVARSARHDLKLPA